jgi:ribosomal protein L37AE/L43A
MSETPKPRVTSLSPLMTTRIASPPEEKMVCERCGGANVYRMHAVWRCADCGFKTDCCGW